MKKIIKNIKCHIDERGNIGYINIPQYDKLFSGAHNCNIEVYAEISFILPEKKIEISESEFEKVFAGLMFSDDFERAKEKLFGKTE